MREGEYRFLFIGVKLLMIILQVVELEISLDETREQYNNVLRTSNNRAQQKKMAFLERNLEQLTVVQRQLVEQNNSLKKDVAIAERKLIARNERIQSLESLLQDSQEKLTQANHRLATNFHTPPLSSSEEGEEDDWVVIPTNYWTSENWETIPSFPSSEDWEIAPTENWEIDTSPPPQKRSKHKANKYSQPRFEVQLTAVKERLEAAKAGSTRGLADSMSGQSFAFSGGSRIAKPLRGGGGGGEQLPVAGVPTISSLKDMDVQGSGAGKRGSWFSNMRV